MPDPNDDSLVRRIEALVRATEKRLDDARDIHRREHAAADTAHGQVHGTEKEGRDESRVSMDKRLEVMNEIRAQLITQASTFQTLAAASVEHKALHTRVDEMRERIVAIEKLDVKSEGKGLGQSAVVAIIVTAIGVVGTVLAIIVTLANVATAP